MEIIQQPNSSAMCGQCVVAMLTNQPLEAIVEILGEGRTWPRDLRKALLVHGRVMAKRSRQFTPDAEKHQAAVFIEQGAHKHWVAWDGQHWFDSNGGQVLSHEQFGAKYPEAVVKLYYVV